MTPSNLKRLTTIVGALILAALLALVFLIGSGFRHRVGQWWERDPAPRPRKVSLEDVHYRELVGENLHDSFRAQSIVVEKSKLGVLTVNRFSEINMRHVEIRLTGEESSLSDVTRLVRRAVTEQDLGTVTRVRIEGLSVSRHRGGWELFSLRAGVAEVDVIERRLTLGRQVSIKAGSGDELSTPAASWDRRTRRLRLSEPYYFNGSPHPNHEGAEFSFDLDGRLGRESVPPGAQKSAQPLQSQSSTLPSPSPGSVSE